MGRFFMLWPDISRMGRITSDIRGMGVTQEFIGIGNIAVFYSMMQRQPLLVWLE